MNRSEFELRIKSFIEDVAFVQHYAERLLEDFPESTHPEKRKLVMTSYHAKSAKRCILQMIDKFQD